jgi:hypothetical protein
LVAYKASELATVHPTTALGVTQGHRVAVVAIVCSFVAGLARFGLARLERRLDAVRVPLSPPRRRLAVGVILAWTVVVALALHVPHTVSSQYHRFVSGAAPTLRGDLRNRLTDVANNGRTEQWNAAFAAFRSSPLHGTGAGTYQLAWESHRSHYSFIKDAHGVYFEVLGELGIVGLVLLLTAVGGLLFGAVRLMGRHRSLGALLLAVFLMWGLRAGVDWDWEMPAVTLWVFALGGAVLARRRRAPAAEGAAPSSRVRILVAIGWLLATAVPALVAISEGHINLGVAALDRGDCVGATHQAFSAISAIADQPRPYEIIGMCDLQGGFPRAATQAMQAAVDRDPGNWQYHYDLAVARAEAGLDPRPELEAARRRSPLDDLVGAAGKLYGAPSAATEWPAAGRKARALLLDAGRVARY